MSNGGPQEVRSQLIEMKRLLVDAMANEQRLYQSYSEANREVQRWRGRAELALGRGSEELARAALGRASDYGDRASRLHQQYLVQKESVETMKARLRDLESRPRLLPAAGRPRELARPELALAPGERREERAREERARLAAWAELERDELAEKLEALEREERLERQLAELKQRLSSHRPQDMASAES